VSGSLVVRARGRLFALPVSAVETVLDVGTPRPAPVRVPAVRGVWPARGALVAVVDLGALLAADAPPAEAGSVGVLVTADGQPLILMVDEAIELLRSEPEALPVAWSAAWASGGVRSQGLLVPVVEIAVLIDRLRAGEVEAGAGIT
jgi:chemotaxis signal transduction protein